ncbi:MAG: ShlB/FhaC/HecB family hemolysin secretion/activation protein [Luteimonas sp.]
MNTKLTLMSAILLVLSQGALAQQQAPVGIGQFQQIPPTPTPQQAAPEIRIERGVASDTAATDNAKITVNSLRITGATVYGEAELLALTGFRPATQLSLAELEVMASKVADYYHAHGYFLAQAYLPPQTITNGAVNLVVMEGHYGTITLRNSSSLSDARLNGFLHGLDGGDPVTIAPLEHRLLLMSDLPGVIVNSTLVASATPGTSDLIVDVRPGKKVGGSIEADNAGNPYTGEIRVGASVYVNNLTGNADVASLRVLTSGDGLKYGQLAYRVPIGKATVGVAYSALQYHLGKQFKALDAHGNAQIASLFGSYPLVRSRKSNLNATAGYDHRKFEDIEGVTNSRTNKSIDAVMLGIQGDHRDDFGGGGYSAYGLTATSGNLDINTPAALFVDQLTARSNGHYGKLAFNAMRLQRLSDSWSLFAAVKGQFASKNLDVSEKMELGGMYAVRAYPEGEAYADEGVVLNVEARWLAAGLSDRMPGQVHLIGFVDAGSVTVNADPWDNADNHRNLSGAGVGATWDDYNNFSVRAYYAWKLGSEVALSSPDKSGRFWIQAVKYF